jgi:hypothetical protein
MSTHDGFVIATMIAAVLAVIAIDHYAGRSKRKCTCNDESSRCPESRIHSERWLQGKGSCIYCGRPRCPAINPKTGKHWTQQ